MKAVLIKTGSTPSRTHDLMILAKNLKTTGVVEMTLNRDLIFLSRAAVTFRYPGESADYSDAQDALIMSDISEIMSKYL